MPLSIAVIPEDQSHLLSWLDPLRTRLTAKAPEILSAANEAAANWNLLFGKMRELAQADLPPDLKQTVETLLYEVQMDMLARWAFLILSSTPLIASHQDLKSWCKALHLALHLFPHRWTGIIRDKIIQAVDIASPLMVEAIRALSPKKNEQLPPVWDKQEWHKQLAQLQWFPLFEPQPPFGETAYCSMTEIIWIWMRRLGEHDIPPEPYNIPDERAARAVLDTVICWCESQQSDPQVKQDTPATDWEFQPGRYWYKRQWHDLSGTKLKLLQAFVHARGRTLTLDAISKLTSPKVSLSRAYGRVTELRKKLKDQLKLSGDCDPLPTVDHETYRLSL